MIGAKRWIRTAGALLILGGLACGGIVLANIAASSSSPTTVVAKTTIAASQTEPQSTEFPSDLLVGVPASLCAEIGSAIQSRLALGSLLEDQGLRSNLPKSAVEGFGPVERILCHSDDLNKKIAVVFENNTLKTAIVLSSHLDWTRQFSVGSNSGPYEISTFIGAESDLLDQTPESVHIDTFLEVE